MYFPSGLGTGLYALSVLRRVSLYSCDLTSEALIRATKNRATKTRATLEWRRSTVSTSLYASTALELLQYDEKKSPGKPTGYHHNVKDRPLLGVGRDEEFEGAGDDLEFDGEASEGFAVDLGV